MNRLERVIILLDKAEAVEHKAKEAYIEALTERLKIELAYRRERAAEIEKRNSHE